MRSAGLGALTTTDRNLLLGRKGAKLPRCGYCAYLRTNAPKSKSINNRSGLQPLADLAEMVSVNGERHRQRDLVGAAEASPEEQAPIMEPLAPPDAEAEIGMDKGHQIAPV